MGTQINGAVTFLFLPVFERASKVSLLLGAEQGQLLAHWEGNRFRYYSVAKMRTLRPVSHEVALYLVECLFEILWI